MGWYTSTFMSSFCTPQLIATQCRYQLDLGNNTVALVIDSLDLSRGKLNLKAFRVNSRFVKLFDENKITLEEYFIRSFFNSQSAKYSTIQQRHSGRGED